MKLTFLALSSIAALVLTSCGTTGAALAGAPPIKISGNYKGQQVSVVVYPDGSKPTEVTVNGESGAPIELDLN